MYNVGVWFKNLFNSGIKEPYRYDLRTNDIVDNGQQKSVGNIIVDQARGRSSTKSYFLRDFMTIDIYKKSVMDVGGLNGDARLNGDANITEHNAINRLYDVVVYVFLNEQDFTTIKFEKNDEGEDVYFSSEATHRKFESILNFINRVPTEYRLSFINKLFDTAFGYFKYNLLDKFVDEKYFKFGDVYSIDDSFLQEGLQISLNRYGEHEVEYHLRMLDKMKILFNDGIAKKFGIKRDVSELDSFKSIKDLLKCRLDNIRAKESKQQEKIEECSNIDEQIPQKSDDSVKLEQSQRYMSILRELFEKQNGEQDEMKKNNCCIDRQIELLKDDKQFEDKLSENYTLNLGDVDDFIDNEDDSCNSAKKNAEYYDNELVKLGIPKNCYAFDCKTGNPIFCDKLLKIIERGSIDEYVEKKVEKRVTTKKINLADFDKSARLTACLYEEQLKNLSNKYYDFDYKTGTPIYHPSVNEETKLSIENGVKDKLKVKSNEKDNLDLVYNGEREKFCGLYCEFIAKKIGLNNYYSTDNGRFFNIDEDLFHDREKEKLLKVKNFCNDVINNSQDSDDNATATTVDSQDEILLREFLNKNMITSSLSTQYKVMKSGERFKMILRSYLDDKQKDKHQVKLKIDESFKSAKSDIENIKSIIINMGGQSLNKAENDKLNYGIEKISSVSGDIDTNNLLNIYKNELPSIEDRVKHFIKNTIINDLKKESDKPLKSFEQNYYSMENQEIILDNIKKCSESLNLLGIPKNCYTFTESGLLVLCESLQKMLGYNNYKKENDDFSLVDFDSSVRKTIYFYKEELDKIGLSSKYYEFDKKSGEPIYHGALDEKQSMTENLAIPSEVRLNVLFKLSEKAEVLSISQSCYIFNVKKNMIKKIIREKEHSLLREGKDGDYYFDDEGEIKINLDSKNLGEMCDILNVVNRDFKDKEKLKNLLKTSKLSLKEQYWFLEIEEINRKKREEIIREATRKLHPTSVINHRDLRLPLPSPMSRNLITRETISKTSTSIQLPCLLYLSQKELSGGSKLPPLKDGEQPITPPTQKLRRNNINPSSQLQRQPAPTWVNE